MKRVIIFPLYIFVVLLLGSCKSVFYEIQSAGELTSVSTRNIDNSKEYKPLKTYSGVSRQDIEAAISSSKNGQIKRKNPIVKEIDQYKAKHINEAIDNVVKTVVGGEYLQNARVYKVQKGLQIFYVVSGDVWGFESENNEIKGFHKSDNVVFTFSKEMKKALGKINFDGTIGKQYIAKILELKGGFATVQLENATVLDIPYTYLTNIGQ